MEGVVEGRVRSSVQLGGMRFGFGLGAADAVFIVGRLRGRYFRGRPGGGSCGWHSWIYNRLLTECPAGLFGGHGWVAHRCCRVNVRDRVCRRRLG